VIVEKGFDFAAEGTHVVLKGSDMYDLEQSHITRHTSHVT
jgi:hypothetical protein